MKPYKETIQEDVIIREFSEDTSQDELEWHRDRYKRKINVLEGGGWKFQLDNQLPFTIKPNDCFTIEANLFHRLIKGKTPLKLRITEYYK